MTKELTVKLSDELHDELEKLAEKTGKSKADIVREALMMYIGAGQISDKPISNITSKTAPALYSSRCRKCGREINQGDLAGFIKVTFEDKSTKTFVYCIDCFQSLSDKTIVSLELKKKQLERVVNALKRERKRLLNAVEELVKIDELLNELVKFRHDLYRYSESVFNGENEAVEKLIDKVDELLVKISDAMKVVKPRVMYHKHRVQIEEEEEVKARVILRR